MEIFWGILEVIGRLLAFILLVLYVYGMVKGTSNWIDDYTEKKEKKSKEKAEAPQSPKPEKIPEPTSSTSRNAVSSFTPNPQKNFCTTEKTSKYSWSALCIYYPQSRFRESDLDYQAIKNRKVVYDFKDGKISEQIANNMASAIFNHHGPDFFKNKTLMIIPASNSRKTNQRFFEFCKYFSEYTGITNGYEKIQNNTLTRLPSNQGGDRNIDLERYLTFNGNFSNESFIILDDVRTTGSSSDKVYNALTRRGAKSIHFFYLAKTASL
jgi:predicted amidophosphoribosyltransferase